MHVAESAQLLWQLSIDSSENQQFILLKSHRSTEYGQGQPPDHGDIECFQ